MARSSTILTTVRLSTESALGVVRASPSWLWPWITAENIVPARAMIQPRHLTADRFLRLPIAGEESAAGTIACIVGPQNFDKLWYGIFANLATSNITDGVTTQYQFKLATSQPTFVMDINKGYSEVRCDGGFIRSADFSVDRNSFLNASLDMQFQRQHVLGAAGSIGSPSLSVLDAFTDLNGTMERDDGLVTDMDGFSLRVNCAPLDFKSFGSQYVSDVLFGKADISWELACAFADDTEFRRFMGNKSGSGAQSSGNRYQTVKLEWFFQTGQNAQTNFPYELSITAYGAIYDTFPHGIASDSEILRTRPVAVVRYDVSAGTDLQVNLTNQTTNVDY